LSECEDNGDRINETEANGEETKGKKGARENASLQSFPTEKNTCKGQKGFLG